MKAFVSDDHVRQIKTSLMEIGFSPRETDIYLCLYIFGPQAVSVIARQVSMKRTSAYHELKKLEENGFIHSYLKNSVTYYGICPIETALEKIEQQAEELKGTKHILQKINTLTCQRMDAYFKEFRDRTKYMEFQSSEEIKWLKLSTLKTGTELCVYACPDEDGQILKITDESFWRQYNRRLIARQVRLKIIIPKGGNIVKFHGIEGGSHQIRRIPYHDLPVPEGIEMTIMDDRIVILESRFGLLIEGGKLVNLQKAAFQLAWQEAM